MTDLTMTNDTALARLHTAEAIGTLVEVMRGGVDTLPGDRIRAANSLLERAHGKPVGQAAASGERKAVSLQLASMSDSELLEVLHNAKALRCAEGGIPARDGTQPGAVGDGSPTPNALPLMQPANGSNNPWD